MKFVGKVSKSEARDYIDENNTLAKKEGSLQSSYNLPKEFFSHAIENNVIIQDDDLDYSRKDKDGGAYVLNENYEFKLGPGIIWLIGQEYEEKENKFIASLNNNGKYQFYRAVYNSFNSDNYNWFVNLFDKNLAGTQLVFDINEIDKILTFDVKFRSIKESVSEDELEENENFNNIDKNKKKFIENIKYPHNRIVFGAPGTGKSYKLEKDKKIFGDNFERVTFHPNYSYAHFVGTYKPVPVKDNENNETITYKYVPGPFMRTYVKALKSIKEGKYEPYLLLIEEINRANVAAVFGDVFQLLDRKDGYSEYEIETTEDMKSYIANALGGNEEEYERIRIPSNMYIWATMNSADQGVFPIDTAFKRRWDFEYIGINENSEGIKDIKVKLGKDNHDVVWNDLRIAINNKLTNVCKVNEDKLLGPYFLSKNVIETTDGIYVKDNDLFIEAFKSKILMYLYEDVGKQHKQKLFEGCSDNSKYSSVCEEFERVGEFIFGEDILSYGTVD